MLLIRDYNQGDVLLAHNASDITLSCLDSSKIKMNIQYGSTEISSFLKPLAGSISIPLSDILKSLGCNVSFSNLTPVYGEKFSIPEVIIRFTDPDTDETVTWRKFVLGGGVDSGADVIEILNDQWLTWRPQESVTSKTATEYLHCILPVEYNARTVSRADVYIDVYTVLSGRHTIQYRSLEPEDVPILASINASYSGLIRHESLADIIADDIVAYDFYVDFHCSTDGVVSVFHKAIKPQRFILRRLTGDTRYFLFRNSFGVFEGISATGGITRKLQGEVSTFVGSGGEEGIVDNGAITSYEINTGFISSERQLTLWTDFLKSSDHYLVRNDFIPRKIIIESPDIQFLMKTVDSLTFEFRMASKESGHHYQNKLLDYYDYDTAEL